MHRHTACRRTKSISSQSRGRDLCRKVSCALLLSIITARLHPKWLGPLYGCVDTAYYSTLAAKDCFNSAMRILHHHKNLHGAIEILVELSLLHAAFLYFLTSILLANIMVSFLFGMLCSSYYSALCLYLCMCSTFRVSCRCG